jgi:hypothetical protein
MTDRDDQNPRPPTPRRGPVTPAEIDAYVAKVERALYPNGRPQAPRGAALPPSDDHGDVEGRENES